MPLNEVGWRQEFILLKIMMKQKITNILNLMIREDNSVGIKSFQVIGDDSFDLKTNLSEFGHQTRLRFEPTGDNAMFRVEITHVCGYLDIRIGPDQAAGQLLRMLMGNTGSFQNTTAFVGVQRYDGDDTFYVTLNSFHHFVTSWSDEEIAGALRLHLFDLTMGLVVKDSSLTMLKMYGE
jgi:hypothetical protein